MHLWAIVVGSLCQRALRRQTVLECRKGKYPVADSSSSGEGREYANDIAAVDLSLLVGAPKIQPGIVCRLWVNHPQLHSVTVEAREQQCVREAQALEQEATDSATGGDSPEVKPDRQGGPAGSSVITDRFAEDGECSAVRQSSDRADSLPAKVELLAEQQLEGPFSAQQSLDHQRLLCRALWRPGSSREGIV
jgi:hypothetical protein